MTLVPRRRRYTKGWELHREHDGHLASAPGDPQGHFVFMTIEHEVEARSSNPEVPQFDSFQERWENGMYELHEAPSPIDL